MRNRLERIYLNMKTRCYNSNSDKYKWYGARGIAVCDEWINNRTVFAKWALDNGYSDELTLDRIDNEGGYSPNNCRWVTIKQQCNNRRTNRVFEINGVKHSLTEWCEIYNAQYKKVRYHCVDRLDIDIETALNRFKMGA